MIVRVKSFLELLFAGRFRDVFLFCHSDSFEIIATVQYISDHISARSNVRVVVIDRYVFGSYQMAPSRVADFCNSVSPFFWADRAEEAADGVNPLVYLLSAVHNVLRLPRPPALVIVRTPVMPESGKHVDDPLGIEWSRLAHHKIYVRRVAAKNLGRSNGMIDVP